MKTPEFRGSERILPYGGSFQPCRRTDNSLYPLLFHAIERDISPRPRNEFLLTLLLLFVFQVPRYVDCKKNENEKTSGIDNNSICILVIIVVLGGEDVVVCFQRSSS